VDYGDDVKETQRRWKVKKLGGSSLDTNLKLHIGDQLVFEGDGTAGSDSKIIRRRSEAADMDWGFNCVFIDGGSDSGEVDGNHLTPTGAAIKITFFRDGDTDKMAYNGEVRFPAPIGSQLLDTVVIWMADEGP
jgi:hypothetical protein